MLIIGATSDSGSGGGGLSLRPRGVAPDHRALGGLLPCRLRCHRCRQQVHRAHGGTARRLRGLREKKLAASWRSRQPTLVASSPPFPRYSCDDSLRPCLGCSLLFHDKSWQPWHPRGKGEESGESGERMRSRIIFCLSGKDRRGHLVWTVETIRVSLFDSVGRQTSHLWKPIPFQFIRFL